MSRWKSLIACMFIGVYVSFLSWGVMAHALKVGLCGNTLSYFVVWDMFCGWTAWDARTHIIAEDSKGNYFEVREPWGEFHPFGHVARIHYDNTNHLLPAHINNVLKHSVHEGIDRVYVVEEVWPKQYNLPPKLYAHYFDRPNDKLSYFHLRAVCAEDGTPLSSFPDWHTQQRLNAVYDNPRLQRQSKQATAMYSKLFTPTSQDSGKTLNSSYNTGLSTN